MGVLIIEVIKVLVTLVTNLFCRQQIFNLSQKCHFLIS